MGTIWLISHTMRRYKSSGILDTKHSYDCNQYTTTSGKDCPMVYCDKVRASMVTGKLPLGNFAT